VHEVRLSEPEQLDSTELPIEVSILCTAAISQEEALLILERVRSEIKANGLPDRTRVLDVPEAVSLLLFEAIVKITFACEEIRSLMQLFGHPLEDYLQGPPAQ
jgi:hypothetical protein